MGSVARLLTESWAGTTAALRRAVMPLGRKIWDFLTSLHLAILLLVALAIAIVPGVIFRHYLAPQMHSRVYPETTIRLMELLRPVDVYHSWLLLFLLSFLVLSLACCTVRRLPGLIPTARDPDSFCDENQAAMFAVSQRWETEGTAARRNEAFRSALGAAFAPPDVTEEEGRIRLVSEKGFLSRFGPYITHLAILVVLFGAAIGSMFGFKSHIEIPDGQEVSRIPISREERPVDLPFSIRNNGVRPETYPTAPPRDTPRT